MNKCSLFDMTFSEIIEDIFGVSFDRLWELALADRERRCAVKIADTIKTQESTRRGF